MGGRQEGGDLGTDLPDQSSTLQMQVCCSMDIMKEICNHRTAVDSLDEEEER